MYFVRLSQRSNLQTRILTFIVHIVFRTTPSELFKSRHILYFYFELHFFLVPALLAPTVACLTKRHSGTHSVRKKDFF